MSKLSFSGHEKFQCRQFWLKKGYDFILEGNKFSDESAVVKLGVGKNMVNSIRYWLKAFYLIDDTDKPKKIAHYIFGKNGKDPYLEDLGTIWLLHYLLVTSAKASIYSLIFNEFRKEYIEFNKKHILKFLKRKCEEIGNSISLNTLKTDIDIFIKNYLIPKQKSRNIEDDFSSLLIDLELLKIINKDDKNIWYKIESTDRDEIPLEIILYFIIEQKTGNSVSFNDLLNKENNIGLVYVMTANGLMKKISEIVDKYPDIVFTEDADIKELQFKKEFNSEVILEEYYAK